MSTLPKASRDIVVERAVDHWCRHAPTAVIDSMPERYCVGVRAYRRDSMGKTGVNDFGLWDDALFYVSPTMLLGENGNTDPSRAGWNAGAGKPMAVLNTGVWAFRRGPHKGRTPALRQFTQLEARAAGVPNDGRFSVTRTYAVGDPRNYQESGYYAINMHPGGINGTSSEGCQTLPKNRADKFLQAVWDDTQDNGVDIIWYCLLDGPIV